MATDSFEYPLELAAALSDRLRSAKQELVQAGPQRSQRGSHPRLGQWKAASVGAFAFALPARRRDDLQATENTPGDSPTSG